LAATAPAGDLNGDGFDDIMIGAYNNDDGSGSGGAVYIFFGAGDFSGTKTLGGVQSADVTIIAEASYGRLGVPGSMRGAGDVNGDGFDDFIVGEQGNDDGGTKDLAGAVQDVKILGKAASDYTGINASGIGDVNGDGFDDIIVGSYGNDDAANNAGAGYVFFGASNFSGTKDLGAINADFTILGKSADDGMDSVFGIGDINDDGFDDFIIAADKNDEGGGADAGAAYIFFGARNLTGTKDLSGVDSADLTILGAGAGDRLADRAHASGVGDINNDGFADFILGAPNNNDGGTDDEGAAYIFFGSSTISGTKDLSTLQSADVTIFGKAVNDFLGTVGGGRSNPGP